MGISVVLAQSIMVSKHVLATSSRSAHHSLAFLLRFVRSSKSGLRKVIKTNHVMNTYDWLDECCS